MKKRHVSRNHNVSVVARERRAPKGQDNYAKADTTRVKNSIMGHTTFFYVMSGGDDPRPVTEKSYQVPQDSCKEANTLSRRTRAAYILTKSMEGLRRDV